MYNVYSCMNIDMYCIDADKSHMGFSIDILKTIYTHTHVVSVRDQTWIWLRNVFLNSERKLNFN